MVVRRGRSGGSAALLWVEDSLLGWHGRANRHRGVLDFSHYVPSAYATVSTDAGGQITYLSVDVQRWQDRRDAALDKPRQRAIAPPDRRAHERGWHLRCAPDQSRCAVSRANRSSASELLP